jgi:hypothetical protein
MEPAPHHYSHKKERLSTSARQVCNGLRRTGPDSGSMWKREIAVQWNNCVDGTHCIFGLKSVVWHELRIGPLPVKEMKPPPPTLPPPWLLHLLCQLQEKKKMRKKRKNLLGPPLFSSVQFTSVCTMRIRQAGRQAVLAAFCRQSVRATAWIFAKTWPHVPYWILYCVCSLRGAMKKNGVAL